MFSHSWCLRVTIYALPQQSINSPKVTLCNIKIKYYWSLWLALNSFGLLGLKLQEIKKNDLLAQIPDQLKIIWLVLISDHRNRIGTFRIFNVQRILQINYACGYIWKLYCRLEWPCCTLVVKVWHWRSCLKTLHSIIQGVGYCMWSLTICGVSEKFWWLHQAAKSSENLLYFYSFPFR